MYTTVPPGPGPAAGPGSAWGIRRAVRLAFPEPASLARDDTHTARLDVYLTDLLQPYGLALAPGALAPDGQWYGEMARALIELAVPAGEEVDLLVLAYSIPDIAPGRSTTTWLSHVCPGRPMAYAVSDAGAAGAFTALKLVQAQAATAGLRRALLIVAEQAALPYDPGVPVTVPAGHTGVAILFGDAAETPGPAGRGAPGREPVATLGAVHLHGGDGAAKLDAEIADLAAAAAGNGAATTAVLGAVLAAGPSQVGRGGIAGVDDVRSAETGRPYTGVWWELAGDLAEAVLDADPPARRLVLADGDPGAALGVAAVDLPTRQAPPAAAEPAPRQVLCLEDFRTVARERVPADVWDFIEGGAEEEQTLAANRRAFAGTSLRPRVLVDVSECDTRTTLLGAQLSTPIGIAPTAYHRLCHPEGEVATAHGAAAAGALYTVSIFASRTLEDVAAAASGPLWLQLYWLRRRDVLAGLVARAADAGYRALVLTLDAPRLGRRHRDSRNAFAVGADIAAVNLDPALMASAHRRETGHSALAAHQAGTMDAAITWADLAWLRDHSTLPLVLKGILTAEDAALAVGHGADAIIVSNHGGRQLDRAVATLDALPEVVAAVGGACPVVFDGGVRGGGDAFIALAHGASAVLLGRPVLWGLAADGAAGVAGVLDLATEELAHTMALAGRPTLDAIDGGALAPKTAR